MITRKKRIDWIDLAKGLTIILVVLGHSTGNGLLGVIVHDVIYSFHMPLFFILSAMTCKLSISDDDFKYNTIKSAKHLLLPYAITHVIRILWVDDIAVFNSIDYWKSALFTCIFSSGSNFDYYGIQVYSIISWFFCVLFFCRTIYDYIHLKIENENIFFICICMCSFMGEGIGIVQRLPFSIDIALASLLFLYFGRYLHSINVSEQPFKKILLWGFIWVLTFFIIKPNFHDSIVLAMAGRVYPLFPICFITGIAGTMIIVEFSAICCTAIKTLCKPMIYLGKNSLYLLCIHSLDEKISIYFESDSHLIMFIKRLVIDLLIFIIVMVIKSIITKIKNIVSIQHPI